MGINFRSIGLLSAIILATPAVLAQNAPQPATAPVPTMVDAATTTELIQQSNVVLLDVRTPTEYATGHVHGARNLDFRASDFVWQVGQLDTAKTYVLYCASGNRSGQAIQLMQEKGFKKVVNAGSFKALKASGLPTK